MYADRWFVKGRKAVVSEARALRVVDAMVGECCLAVPALNCSLRKIRGLVVLDEMRSLRILSSLVVSVGARSGAVTVQETNGST